MWGGLEVGPRTSEVGTRAGRVRRRSGVEPGRPDWRWLRLSAWKRPPPRGYFKSFGSRLGSVAANMYQYSMSSRMRFHTPPQWVKFVISYFLAFPETPSFRKSGTCPCGPRFRYSEPVPVISPSIESEVYRLGFGTERVQRVFRYEEKSRRFIWFEFIRFEI